MGLTTLNATTNAGYDFEQYSVGDLKMKSSMIMASLVLAAAAGAAQAGGDNINVGDRIRFFDREGTSGGGEFGVAKLPASNAEIFRTFCLQRNEYMDYNAAGFKVIGVSTATVAGNIALSSQAAYLYTQMRSGNWVSAAFADAVSSNVVDTYGGGAANNADWVAEANGLQAAIWSFMGQGLVSGSALQNQIRDRLISEANTAVSTNAWTGIGNVRILNLTWATSRSGYLEDANAQDQLVMIPLPTGAALGLAGLSVLAIRRRAAR